MSAVPKTSQDCVASACLDFEVQDTFLGVFSVNKEYKNRHQLCRRCVLLIWRCTEQGLRHNKYPEMAQQTGFITEPFQSCAAQLLM